MVETDCDDHCNLCACNTGYDTEKMIDHCNGNGECKANCTSGICHSARCECERAWTGNKCDIPRKSFLE